MSNAVVSFDTGASFIADRGSLVVVALQGEANVIKVKGDLPIAIIGSLLDDKVTLGAGNATVLGQDGENLIKGAIGDDTLMGSIGADFIVGGDGNDLIKGGASDDIFEFVAGEFESEAMDRIVDFGDGADSITIEGISDNVTYNSDTGILSIDGKEAIAINKGIEDVQIERKEANNTWEIF